MKVTMTNAEAVQKLNSLRELEKLNNPVPALAGYRIVQNIHALADALAPYTETRDKIIKKYAKAGQTVISRDTDPETFDACAKEIATIDRLTIDVEVNTFPLSAIAEGKFPLNVFFILDFMIQKTSKKEV